MRKKKKEATFDEKLLILIKVIVGVFLALMLLLPIYMPHGLLYMASSKKNFYYGMVCAGILPALALSFVYDIKKKHKFNYVYGFAMGYALSTIISFALSDYKGISIYGTDGWYTGTLFLLSLVLVFYICSRFTPSVKWFVDAFIVVGVIISAGCILAKFDRFPIDLYSIIQGGNREDFLPFLGQKNWYAAYMALIFPLALGMLLVAKGKEKIRYAVALLFIIPAMIMQGSDSIYVSAFMVILFFMFMYGRKPVKIVAASIAILVPVVLFILIRLNTSMGEDFVLHKYLSDTFFTWGDDWGTHRGRNWKMAMRMFDEFDLKSKLFGVGPDCYDIYLKTYYQRFYSFWNSILDNAHNEVLTVLICQGIVGVVTYFGFFVSVLVCGIRKREKSKLIIPLCACIIGWFFNNIFSFMTVASTSLLFVILSFILYL